MDEQVKKFILINSPLYQDATSNDEQYLPPLGLGYIATYLDAAGFDVRILDCVKERLSVSDALNVIANERPEYLGINVFTQNYDLVKSIAENLRCETVLFVGGQVVKHISQEILNWNVRNELHLIVGEGEYIIPALALGKTDPSSKEPLPNKYVHWVDVNSPYYPKDISEIKLDRKYLSNEILTNHYNQNEAAIITSRGCPFNCTFCGGARALNHDIGIRTRTKESVIDEIQYLLALYPELSSIRVLDDLFLKNKRSMRDAEYIFSRFPQLTWRGMAHTISMKKSMSEVYSLAKSGCKELFIGIESGSNTIRERIKKPGTADDVFFVARAILEAGIDLKGYFICGFPEETEADLQQTLALAQNIQAIALNTPGRFRTSVFQFRPYHGTQLYNEIRAKGRAIDAIHPDIALNALDGRFQFNFTSGNYSLVSDDLLREYIWKIQGLPEEK